MTFKVGQETICYQHQQVQDLLEAIFKLNSLDTTIQRKLIEAIEWIAKANDSAVRMENKLTKYKQQFEKELPNQIKFGTKAKLLTISECMERRGWKVGDIAEVVSIGNTEPVYNVRKDGIICWMYSNEICFNP